MPDPVKRRGAEERQLVVFNLGNEEFGVDISEVREIIRMEQVTRIPNTQGYINGVINLRGGIIVVIDLATKIGLPTKAADNNTRIIVIDISGNTVGMVVDSATEVLRLSAEDIKEAPAIIKQKIDSDFIEGVGIISERLLILLDLAKVMQAKDIAVINRLQETAIPEKKPEAATQDAGKNAETPGKPAGEAQTPGSQQAPQQPGT